MIDEKEELKQIAELINKYANKYHCRIELTENFDGYYANDTKEKYTYKVIAKKEDKIKC